MKKDLSELFKKEDKKKDLKSKIKVDPKIQEIVKNLQSLPEETKKIITEVSDNL